MKKRDGDNNSLWSYAEGRKWRPLHNSVAFDGFKEQTSHFTSVIYDNGIIRASGLSKSGYDEDIVKLNEKIVDKDNKVNFYFWHDEKNIFYLMTEVSENKYSIWHYTDERKWEPLHNAKAFDGFPEAKETLSNIVLDKKSRTLTIGKAITAPKGESLLTNKEPIQFVESDRNDGRIKDKVTLEFANNTLDNSMSDRLLELITIKNLPQGLSAEYTFKSLTSIEIRLAGRATSHDAGTINLTIEISPTLWKNVQTKQIFSAKIIFSANTGDISDIREEPYYRFSWHQNATDMTHRGKKVLNDSHINMEKAWGLTRGKGVKVAVIDTNFDLAHYDLQNIETSYDASTGSSDVNPKGSGESHGTSVLGVMIAGVNALGTVGIAPESKGIAIGFPKNTKISTLVAAFTFAKDNGAKVVNCSWGSGSASVVNLLKPIIKELYDAGIVIVFATGNESKELRPGGDESTLPTVIGVGGSNEFNERASYANFGAGMDVVAPAGELGIPTPDVLGNRGYSKSNGERLNSDYTFARGTSFASPIVAGVVALMFSVNPDLTPSQVRQILIDTTDKIFGNYNSDGYDLYTGFGKINAYKAVLKAKNSKK